MSDLVEFLTARLDEDEPDCRTGIASESYLSDFAERLLREVKAKRQILERLYPEIKNCDELIEGEWNSNPYNADTLLELLALPYADHPDFRDEWRP